MKHWCDNPHLHHHHLLVVPVVSLFFPLHLSSMLLVSCPLIVSNKRFEVWQESASIPPFLARGRGQITPLVCFAPMLCRVSYVKHTECVYGAERDVTIHGLQPQNNLDDILFSTGFHFVSSYFSFAAAVNMLMSTADAACRSAWRHMELTQRPACELMCACVCSGLEMKQ